MTQRMFGWKMDKNVEDFSRVAKNLREEGCSSRAEVIDYLIARVIVAEEKIRRISKLHEIYKKTTDGIIAIQNGEEFNKNELVEALRNYPKDD